jgi:hypothetical protein
MDIQLTDVAHLDVDVMQRTVCAEKDCPRAGPLSAFVCYRVWAESQQTWQRFAFCSHAHALACFPTTALGQA